MSQKLQFSKKEKHLPGDCRKVFSISAEQVRYLGLGSCFQMKAFTLAALIKFQACPLIVTLHHLPAGNSRR